MRIDLLVCDFSPFLPHHSLLFFFSNKTCVVSTYTRITSKRSSGSQTGEFATREIINTTLSLLLLFVKSAFTRVRASAVLAKVEFETVTISKSLIFRAIEGYSKMHGKLTIWTSWEACVYDVILKTDNITRNWFHFYHISF